MDTPSIDYNALGQALLAQIGAVGYKAVSSTPTASYAHGPGGLFSSPGLNQRLFSAMVLPRLGLQSYLPLKSSREMNPLYGIITGVTATSGAEPIGVCDDPPIVGLAKLCTHSFVFGRQERQTRVFDVSRFGQVINRSDFTDLSIFGGPFKAEAGRTNEVPTLPGEMQNQFVNNEVFKGLFEFGTAWLRDFAQEVYTGNPANNTSGGGRKYFYGLDILLNTGYRDAETGTVCAAADSIVASFGNQDIATNGGSIVRAMTYIYRNLRYNANRMGLDPAKWVLAMPFAAFYELTEVWPCAYLSYRCTVSGSNSTNYINAEDQITMRDEMRGDMDTMTGQYLLIDGQKVPVVLDNAIQEYGIGGGTQRSSIYFVPLTVLGSTPVTYMEYFDVTVQGGPLDGARAFGADGSYYASDDGRFLWHRKPPTNFCIQLLALTQTRLMCLTPYLGARLTNIQYTPYLKERSPFTDSAYFVNGGRTAGGTGPSYYSPT